MWGPTTDVARLASWEPAAHVWHAQIISYTFSNTSATRSATRSATGGIRAELVRKSATRASSIPVEHERPFAPPLRLGRHVDSVPIDRRDGEVAGRVILPPAPLSHPDTLVVPVDLRACA